jgi:hypothetical protein
MKQLKTILNKKLFFLFIVLGSAMRVQAQTDQSTPETFCQGFPTPRNYAVDKTDGDGTNGTPGSSYVWSVTTSTLNPVPTVTITSNSISNHAIKINWSTTPAGNYIVHVVETNNSCVAIQKDLAVIINASPTPTFTQLAAICSGSTGTVLPTTSTNSITGTWSPAINNLATTTYTFTPTTGTCATTATMTITVTPKTTPTFTQVAAVCSGATIAALPTTSTNAVTGTWSPAINNTATTLYTFTPSDAVCNNVTTMTITVNPKTTPTFMQVAAVCSGATIAALPTTSTNAVTGTWSPAVDNTATTTYTFTPTAGLCADGSTMIITVNPSPTTSDIFHD